MQKFIIFKSRVIFIFAFITLSLPACVNNSSNSNVAVLYPEREPASAAPSVEPTAQASLSPTVSPTATAVASPMASTEAVASPSPVDDPFVKNDNAAINNDPNVKDNNAAAPVASSGTLMIPVIGIKREDLRDTFDDARSEGRVHDAIDIMAAGGTPVVAAADGKIVKFFDSVKGGITIYQLGPDEHTVYYYAHLQRRADGLAENTFVKQGALLGYVGDTGNAGPGNYHLHFAIWTISDPKRFYDGTNINPYPLLKQGIIKPQ